VDVDRSDARQPPNRCRDYPIETGDDNDVRGPTRNQATRGIRGQIANQKNRSPGLRAILSIGRSTIGKWGQRLRSQWDARPPGAGHHHPSNRHSRREEPFQNDGAEPAAQPEEYDAWKVRGGW